MLYQLSYAREDNRGVYAVSRGRGLPWMGKGLA